MLNTFWNLRLAISVMHSQTVLPKSISLKKSQFYNLSCVKYRKLCSEKNSWDFVFSEVRYRTKFYMSLRFPPSSLKNKLTIKS